MLTPENDAARRVMIQLDLDGSSALAVCGPCVAGHAAGAQFTVDAVHAQ